MSTDVENGIKLASPRKDIRELVRVLPESSLLLQERLGDGVGLEHLDGVRVQRGLAALGGGDGELDLVVQDLMRVSELGLIVKKKKECVVSLSFLGSMGLVCIDLCIYSGVHGLTRYQPVGP